MYQTKFDGLLSEFYSSQCSYFTNRKSSAEVVKEHTSISKEKSRTFLESYSQQQIKYGKEERQHMDVYYPKDHTPDTAIVVFFHGGYWQEGSAVEHAFVAKPFVEAGRVCIIPNRILFPKVRIGDINKQDMEAMDCIATTFPHAKNMTMFGHSSGGCECITMLQTNWSKLGYRNVEKYLQTKLACVLIACGVLEVTHLLNTAVDEPSPMSWAEALSLSPIAHIKELKQNLKDHPRCSLYFLTAEHDAPTILKWTKIFLKELQNAEIPFESEYVRGMDHFNILTTIDESNSVLAKMVLGTYYCEGELLEECDGKSKANEKTTCVGTW